MTDPDWADATYLEPLDLEGVTGVLRARAARRAAADARRPDGAQPRHGARARGRAGGARDRADRRLRQGDPHRRGPRGVRRGDGLGRPARAALGDRAHARGGARGDRRRAAAAGRDPARRSRSAATAAASRARRRSSTRSSLRGLSESPISQVLVEESVEGWGEFELEVIRDRLDNVVIVCSIENLDPMGVHTGDSVCCAPAMTLSDREYQALRDAAAKVIRAVGVETGGSNVQFARQPRDRRDRRDRDEPARLALVRARLQGHGLPDREGRDAARDRLHAGRDPERHHRHDARLVRADDRLRRRQGAALRVREVRRLRRDADDADEVGRRGDGHRPLLQRGLRQGDALARARPRSARGRRARRRRPGIASTRCSGACARARTRTRSRPRAACTRGSATSSPAASRARTTPPRAASTASTPRRCGCSSTRASPTRASRASAAAARSRCARAGSSSACARSSRRSTRAAARSPPRRRTSTRATTASTSRSTTTARRC